MLLERQDIEVNASNINGATPLHLATLYKKSDNALSLLNQKAIEINVQDSFGNIPLHLAPKEGSDKIIVALLRHPDIDVNVQNNSALIALASTVAFTISTCAHLILKRKDYDATQVDQDDISPFDFAVVNKCKHLIELLLTKPEINVASRDVNNWTVIYFAAGHGTTEILSLPQ